MKFTDEVIENLDLNDVDDFVRLIVEYLCGEIHYNLPEADKNLLKDLMENAKEGDLNYEQFNELLLLLNQDRVSKGFFKKFFFGKESISLDELRKGVIEFRGFAMLCFGNFRFAYKYLIQKDEQQLKKVHKSYCKESKDILEKFTGRPRKMLRIQPISRDETWYLGNISKQKLDNEYVIVEDLVSSLSEQQNENFKISKQELLEVSRKYLEIQDAIIKAQDKALRNTDIYLTWDYMDVYIATSMRHKWEFEEAFDFIKEVFSDDSIKKLHLRYFDPTQSKCKNRIDKGLIEGLMLKRVQCCIYMAQESDTMGKDSELAATLAQGKPVIAYIPKVNIDKYLEKIKRYPLDYFEKRLLILQAEGVFDDKECVSEFGKCDNKFEENIQKFHKDLDNYRNLQPLTLWQKKENEFKYKNNYFDTMCRILAIAEHYHFEKRADILKKYHPLAIQVDLKTGVANGVLVARSIKECAKLLYQILTNNLEFIIKHKVENITELVEKITACPFRVVTDDEKLTNSFWNFYLTKD